MNSSRVRSAGQHVVSSVVTVEKPLRKPSLGKIEEGSVQTDWRQTPSYILGGGVSDRDTLDPERFVSGAGGKNVFKDKPWNAPSVQELTSQRGKSSNSNSLIIEGRTGDILKGVGSDVDNNIATLSLSNKRCNQESKVFGAVYEHRDCFGKPQFIGQTDSTPECKFSQDVASHQAIRNMRTYQGGTANVVWAARGNIGTTNMENITQNIVDRRGMFMIHM